MVIMLGFCQIFDALDRSMAATEGAAAISRQAVQVFENQHSCLRQCKTMLEGLMQTSRTVSSPRSSLDLRLVC